MLWNPRNSYSKAGLEGSVPAVAGVGAGGTRRRNDPAASRRRDAACGLLRAATLVATLLAGMLPARSISAQPDAPAVPRPQAPTLDVAALAPIADVVEAQMRAGNLPGAVVLIGHGAASFIAAFLASARCNRRRR